MNNPHNSDIARPMWRALSYFVLNGLTRPTMLCLAEPREPVRISSKGRGSAGYRYAKSYPQAVDNYAGAAKRFTNESQRTTHQGVGCTQRVRPSQRPQHMPTLRRTSNRRRSHHRGTRRWHRRTGQSASPMPPLSHSQNSQPLTQEQTTSF